MARFYSTPNQLGSAVSSRDNNQDEFFTEFPT
uniref:Uncharacterized protein n=1 Tax=Cyanothece sp. (strain PCC 7425 / ATCC 29141) TaxID=395961 RepID=B8HKJ0_CYAP4